MEVSKSADDGKEDYSLDGRIGSMDDEGFEYCAHFVKNVRWSPKSI